MCFSGRLRHKSDQPVTAIVEAGTLKKQTTNCTPSGVFALRIVT